MPTGRAVHFKEVETLKIVAVVGLAGAAVAVGLGYAWSAMSGRAATGDELVRHATIAFLVAACTVGVLRRDKARRS